MSLAAAAEALRRDVPARAADQPIGVGPGAVARVAARGRQHLVAVPDVHRGAAERGEDGPEPERPHPPDPGHGAGAGEISP